LMGQHICDDLQILYEQFLLSMNPFHFLYKQESTWLQLRSPTFNDKLRILQVSEQKAAVKQVGEASRKWNGCYIMAGKPSA
ncbi:MAG TPA: hypothetical protein VGT82_17555, partial [Ktedonobacteraceae bacterium]|nr:hypothetical protein [Ktedonobacteraceae bacterium]